MEELEALIRQSISEEQKAVTDYLNRKQRCLDLLAQDNCCQNKLQIIADTFEDILQEEQIHIGQFEEMLDLINVSREKEQEGEQEAQEDILKSCSTFTDLTTRLQDLL